MPIVLQTLFCSPQDVWDLLSSEGVDLRQDDHNLASGQIIQTSSDTPVGSTTMAVVALPVALLNGAQLTFDSSGMTVPVIVQLTVAANVGATSLSILTTTVDIPTAAQARDSGVNAATGARLLVGARKGTSKVKLYCNSRYDDSQLKLSGSVCDWSALAAAKFLCSRRAQGCPKSIAEDYKEAIEEMRMVQSGQLQIEDIGTRGVDWPTVTNVTVDPSYDFMRARVEPNMSEQTPTAYSQFIDWNSAAWIEY
jgi:hypothetical protein